jgi:hypothetical protein
MSENLATAQLNAELEQRLARARALVAEKEKAREQREADNALIREVEEAELKARNAEAVEAAELAHGEIGKKIALTYTPLGVIIVKRPHTALFRRFQDSKEASTEEALKLVRPSVVYPDRATFDEWIDKVPGVLFSLTKQCSHLSGYSASEAAGK